MMCGVQLGRCGSPGNARTEIALAHQRTAPVVDLTANESHENGRVSVWYLNVGFN